MSISFAMIFCFELKFWLIKLIIFTETNQLILIGSLHSFSISSLKQHFYYFSFYLSEVWILYSVSQGAEIKVSVMWGCHLGIRIPSKLTGCWKNPFPCSSRLEVPIFLLTVPWGPHPHPRDCPRFLALQPPKVVLTGMFAFSLFSLLVSLTFFSVTSWRKCSTFKGPM